MFFSHALEILLHTVVEADASSGNYLDGQASTDSILPTAIEFLDHFDVSLEVVVGCARKTEMSRWRRLFDIVGNPKTLFEVSLASLLLASCTHRLITGVSGGSEAENCWIIPFGAP